MQTLKNTMIMVVESLINKFEEDQMRKEEMHREKQQQSNSQYTDNCSDSDSSFNQVRDTVDTLFYYFISFIRILLMSLMRCQECLSSSGWHEALLLSLGSLFLSMVDWM